MILVTGATGSLGPHIVEGLLSSGYKVRILSRNLPAKGMRFDGVEVKIGDVVNPDSVRAAVEGVDAVIHMAALLRSKIQTAESKELHRRINVDGASFVVKAAVAANVRRLVFFSTFDVYGDSNGRVINEYDAAHPTTLYGQTKLEAEQIVLAAQNTDGLPLGTVLRVAPVYGPRIRGNYRQLLMALAKHRFIPVGQGTNRRTVIYADDVVNAAVLAVKHPSAAGRIFNVTDGAFHDMNEIVSTICEALGRRPPHLTLPARPVRFVVGVAEDLAGLAGFKSPITRATIDKYVEDIAIDGKLMQSILAFSPRYDLITGWRETIKELRQLREL